MIFDLKKNWNGPTYPLYPIIAFDTETSGQYPIESEIIELGAVKWFDGKIVDRFQTLLKPSRPLEKENIRIHGITNEMVADAPKMQDKILSFCEFIDGSILIAHHAPSDLGFLTLDIEKSGLRFPSTIQLCTSLLSRALLTTTNHKLQTLIKELNLIGGDAHRAYDDAYACLQVFFRCLDKMNSPITLEKLLSIQKKQIAWNKYQIWTSEQNHLIMLAEAARDQRSVQISYKGGQTRDVMRPIQPIGIVRNPDGDYVAAICGIDHQKKRFYIDKIAKVATI